MLELSKEIKLIVSDFDGVFTDGSVYISEKNEVQKKLNFKDIMGVSILIKNGYKFEIICDNPVYFISVTLCLLVTKNYVFNPR